MIFENVLSWRDFVEKLPSENRQLFIDIFETAEKLFTEFDIGYCATGEQPKIYVQTEGTFYAKSLYDENAVLISKVTLDYCLQAQSLQILSLSNIHAMQDAHHVSKIMILVILAHEYFHLKRGHFKVLSIGIDGKAKAALEYDADNMAAVGLYRYLQGNCRHLGGNLQIKKYINYCVFWPMRFFITIEMKSKNYDPFKIDGHPSLFYRLVYTGAKLAWVDNFHPTTREPYNNFFTDADALKIVLIQCEQEYIKQNNISAEKFNVLKFLESYSLTINPLIQTWEEEVEPLVEKHNTLRGLDNPNNV